MPRSRLERCQPKRRFNQRRATKASNFAKRIQQAKEKADRERREAEEARERETAKREKQMQAEIQMYQRLLKQARSYIMPVLEEVRRVVDRDKRGEFYAPDDWPRGNVIEFRLTWDRKNMPDHPAIETYHTLSIYVRMAGHLVAEVGESYVVLGEPGWKQQLEHTIASKIANNETFREVDTSPGPWG